MIDIPHDKLLHFNGGMLISIIVGAIFTPLIGFLAGSAIGVLKEVRDSKGFGTPDVMDTVATALGAAVPLLILAL